MQTLSVRSVRFRLPFRLLVFYFNLSSRRAFAHCARERCERAGGSGTLVVGAA